MTEKFKKIRDALIIEKGLNTDRFLMGVALVGPFFVLAKGLTFAMHVIAGRVLGPSEYGMANVILAVAGILLVPIQLGFPTIIQKFSAIKEKQDEQATVVSSTLCLQLAWLTICAASLFVIRHFLANVFDISISSYVWSLLLACAMTVHMVLIAALQGIKLFKARGVVEFIYALFALLLFGYLCFFVLGDFRSYVLSIIVSMFAVTILSLYYLLKT